MIEADTDNIVVVHEMQCLLCGYLLRRELKQSRVVFTHDPHPPGYFGEVCPNVNKQFGARAPLAGTAYELKEE